MWLVCTELQIVVHQRQRAPHRLQPLRNLHGLCRGMHPKCHCLRSTSQNHITHRERKRAHRTPAISCNSRHTDGRRHRSPGEESRRRSRPHHRQEDSSSGHSPGSARSRKPSKPAATLHSLPTLRVGMSQSGSKAIGQTIILYATRDVV